MPRKKKAALSGIAGFLVEAIRFSFVWMEKSVITIFKISPSIGRFFKKLNTSLDNITKTKWGYTIPTYLKIIFLVIVILITWKVALVLFIGYIILKSIP